jgi:hypothetical protein
MLFYGVKFVTIAGSKQPEGKKTKKDNKAFGSGRPGRER